ncbi:MAG: nuclear transport factor 2 family protein [Gammaproteobacteria bacterium]|nr:nuclear transport factor 2 family protein [Gammaproteobacteria bacterium]
MIDSQSANEFADHWIKAWNAHDLEEILSHYTDDFEMTSPVIVGTMNEPSGKLKGKESICVYWSKALANYPELHFYKRHVLVGASSVTIIYDGVKGLSAEVFHFNDQTKVYAAYAHYDL